jgi:hypothetical protein
MKESNRERARAVVSDLVGIAILGILMATVVEALSPENLLHRDPGALASAAGPGGPPIASFSRVA